jgi:protein TonB
MPLEPQEVSAAVQEESLGSLRGCLVEGDPEQLARERRVRRRSLVISILIQTVVLALLMLLPLFGKTERIALAMTTPIPPYSPYKGTSHDPGPPHDPIRRQNLCHFCAPPSIPHIIVAHDQAPTASDPGDPSLEGLGSGIPGVPTGLIPIPDTRANVQVEHTDHRAARPSVIHEAHIDPALLIRRVEPAYPALARQTHREGRVELRAIIGTDGSIQSLQVVSGDLIFVQSAVEAVQQWHYKPTFLGGQPVAVDTYITVIYTMPH